MSPILLNIVSLCDCNSSENSIFYESLRTSNANYETDEGIAGPVYALIEFSAGDGIGKSSSSDVSNDSGSLKDKIDQYVFSLMTADLDPLISAAVVSDDISQFQVYYTSLPFLFLHCFHFIISMF